MIGAGHYLGRSNYLAGRNKMDGAILQLAFGWRTLKSCGCPPEEWPEFLQVIYRGAWEKEHA